MKDEAGKMETKGVAEARGDPARGLSRRTFIKGASTIGAGTLVAGGAGERASAQYGPSSVDGLSAEQLATMYADMLRIRFWESKVKDLILEGGFRGVAHLYVGDDYIASTHRGHGHLIAKGGDLGKMLAEIQHKATGYCRGYGGSLHITDMSLGILGMNGIVGSSHLFAAGAAYGIKVKGTDQVAVSFGGDGSIQGPFFTSAANAAAAWQLPWISVIENNGFQIWVRATDVYGIVDLARRADGYGIEGRVVDGNDVLSVYNLARYAVQKARSGGGPTVIECKTYRWYDHYGTRGARIGVDGAFGLGYRSDRELRDWMAKDPIERFRRFLLREEVITAERADQIVAEVRQAVEDAARFADEQPVPNGEDGLLNVFAEGAVPLHTT
jgi:TPP-dependent pyruvate/acetoin dehydrogenase alpha subunit